MKSRKVSYERYPHGTPLQKKSDLEPPVLHALAGTVLLNGRCVT